MIAILAVVTSICLIVGTDKFGRRNIVLVSAGVCTVTMAIVGGLGQVKATQPLKDFLIFVACVWSLFSAARKSSSAVTSFSRTDPRQLERWAGPS